MSPRETERTAAAIRANPEPHHVRAPTAANDDWQQVPDGPWGRILVAASVVAVIVAMVLL